MKKSTLKDIHGEAALPAVPLGFARSAMFGVARHDRTVMVSCHPIPINDPRGISFIYSGPKLSHYHALLWQAVIQAAQCADVKDETPFTVSADALLRAMGSKGGDTKQRGRVWEWLKDLTAARVELLTRSKAYVGPLVLDAARDDRSGTVCIRLNSKLIGLLDYEVLRNELARKSALGRNLLAMWLHDYFATHLRPQPERIARLRDVCGSPLALPQFRQRLRTAMTLLTEGERPLVTSWCIDKKDRLIVRKNPTSVELFDPKNAEAKQRGVWAHDRKADAIQKARAQRARVAL